LRVRFGLAVWAPSAPLPVSAGAWARWRGSGELKGRIGIFLLRFGLAAHDAQATLRFQLTPR